jgi:nitrogen fixation/metabolism regulation signal transduction histidine kinase
LKHQELVRKFLGPIPIVVVSAFFLMASFLLSIAAQKAHIGGQGFTALLAVNLVGILVLSLFVIANFIRLLNQYRKRVMGSRLMMRLVALFIVLTCLPIGVVYYFSAQFLSKGIDSWFDVRIEQALGDALLLGQGFLEASKDELENKAQEDARRVSNASSNIEIIRLLDEIRLQRTYIEIDLYDSRGQVIATSNQNPTTLFTDTPDKRSMNQARAGGTVAKLEPIGNALQYRVLVPVKDRSLTGGAKVLQVIELLPLRYARLVDSLELASTEYKRLTYLRKPLKISFLISLSLITIMTVLISIWIALFAARRLVAPLRDLAEGTRLVAAGDYHTRLPVKSDDELGSLVGSFNTMISQIRRSQSEAEANHQKELSQRAYLQTVLSHLSSGVLSVNAEGELQTANQQASKILKLNLDKNIGELCSAIATRAPQLAPIFALIEAAINGAEVDKKDISIESDRGKLILITTITKLDIEAKGAGWVVVFDDVTKLVNAQKDAAWGEVARRLAHEIKNPLTPIQLSAERIRRKYLHQLDLVDRDALDRSTRTISEQVETMKRMVDAFANYAQSERLHFERFDYHELIKDSVELNKPLDITTHFELLFFEGAQLIEADKDAVRQVLNNLIANALDATSTLADAQITVRTEPKVVDDAQGISLFIEDSGAGFNPEMLNQLFEPYVTSKQQGTGLGMAIVKRIVEAHDGYVVASNSGTLAGGSVNVWLPIKHHD